MEPCSRGCRATDAPASFGAWAPSAASRPLILPNGDCLFTANLNPQTTGLPQPEGLLPSAIFARSGSH
ncbi:hypothetical protein Q8A67_024208 [Cirrhinus molitorella]|uniref:Uncharacterized protein n=1 Tax=Cirrhinus molitorella TaxID=172907 RepID=A0AA88P3S4_9TELE|nr:hypothetical protein Q8A67_024208 [Cirrhinus molitorella]